MTLKTQDLKPIAEKAIKAALKAGKNIKSFNNKKVEHHLKQTNDASQPMGGTTLASQVVTDVDKACQDIILKELEEVTTKFDFGLLTEEAPDDGSRFEKDYFWCIDPLDGTLPFINKEAGYSVSIALVSKEGQSVIGVIFDPVTDTTYHAINKVGAFKNGKEWQIEYNSKKITWITDKSFTQHADFYETKQKIEDIAHKHNILDLNIIAQGGGAMNAIWVIENAPACFFKPPKKNLGGGCVWDYAATSCIFNEMGLEATTFSGKEFNFNPKGSTFMNELGIFYAAGIDLKHLT